MPSQTLRRSGWLRGQPADDTNGRFRTKVPLECGGAPPLLKSLLVDNRYEVVADCQRVGPKPVDRLHHCREATPSNHLPTKHTKRRKNFRRQDRQVHGLWARGARIRFSDNGQRSRADPACSPLRRGSSEPARGVHQSIQRLL
jgi:hypothetical protein